ncbi:MAG: hypothetical protein R3C20_05035 [Planctomycetaceae bacterium]
MPEIRRYSLTAIVLLVGLRLAIGWQLLYEGLWKIDTYSTPRPWTSAGYLKNSEGPLRDVFRSMAGDPDELGWLDYGTVANRWKDWSERFQSHYNLSSAQIDSLNRMLNGSVEKVGDQEVFSAKLAKLPNGIEKLNVNEKIAWFDANAQKLFVSAQRFLTPQEKARLESLVKGREDAESRLFLTAVDTVYENQKRGMGYYSKLAGTLRGDPELVGNEDWQLLGKLEQYQSQLAHYQKAREEAKSSFQWDHLNYEWGKLQTLRTELTSPVKALEAELQEKAQKMLSVGQLQQGSVSEPWTLLRVTDILTIAGLTILGVMLLLGLGTRLACIMAAFMLFNFYMAMPPWPGVPEAPGPEHSFIINKNLIEVIALCGLAALPTGYWFGLDSLMKRWLASRSTAPAKAGQADPGAQAAPAPAAG